jgi:hypothetical protein
MKAEQVSRWVQELAKSEAIILYAHGDPAKTYGHFPNWEKYQRVYGLHSKFPSPTAESRIIPQLAAQSGRFSQDAESRHMKEVLDALPTLAMVSAAFNTFWSIYPSRNGKKLEKEEARRRFQRLSMEDQTLCCQAAKNFAASQQVRDGIGIKDPKRFIRDGAGQEPWRDWLSPDSPTINGKALTCQWSIKIEGSQRMKPCGEPIAPIEDNPQRRPFCMKCLRIREALDKQIGRTS